MRRISIGLFVIASSCWAAQAGAVNVAVEVTGSVDYNQITSGAFADFAVGDSVTLSFTLDSTAFVNDPARPTRGYVINADSFSISNGSTSVGLVSPYPATPYFVLRNDDPAVDGFFISESTGSPGGLATEEAGVFGAFYSDFLVTYDNNPLGSLNVVDAAGVYDFTGLTVFNMGVTDGPFIPMGIEFGQLSIEVSPVPLPAAVWLMIGGLGTLLGFRRNA